MKAKPFWSRVRIIHGCWEWTGGRKQSGYGNYWNGGHMVAHRYAYEDWYGQIPEGLTIDHLCRNRSCVRPDHLEAVSMRENTRRGIAPSILADREGRCFRGHTDIYETSHGTRCRTCRRENSRSRYHGNLEYNRAYQREWKRRKRAEVKP